VTGGPSAAGTPPPDLALLTSTTDLPALVDRKLVMPLEQVLQADRAVSVEEFAPGALEAVRTHGKVAALPLSGSVFTLYYDSALFAADGVPKPRRDWTWGTLAEASVRLTRKDGDGQQWGIMAHNQPWLLLNLIWSYGGELVTKDGKRALLGEPAAREALQYWADLLLRHRVAPLPPMGLQLSWSATPNGLWVNTVEAGRPGQPTSRGRLGMMLNSGVPSLSLPSSPPATPLVRTVMAAHVPKGRQQATGLLVNAAMVIGAKTRDQRLALRAALAVSDRMQHSALSAGAFPVRAVSADLLRSTQPEISEEDAALLADAFGYSRGVPPEVSTSIFSVLSTRVMAPIANGEVSVDDAAQNATAALNEALAM
jgi:ABC-type glycerol-3-phosphate transport system substrate-binding protein